MLPEWQAASEPKPSGACRRRPRHAPSSAAPWAATADPGPMSIWTRITDALAALVARGEGLLAVFDRRAPEGSVAFTIAILSLGAKMAKADGLVRVAEVAAFREVFQIAREGRGGGGPRLRPRPPGHRRLRGLCRPDRGDVPRPPARPRGHPRGPLPRGPGRRPLPRGRGGLPERGRPPLRRRAGGLRRHRGPPPRRPPPGPLGRPRPPPRRRPRHGARSAGAIWCAPTTPTG